MRDGEIIELFSTGKILGVFPNIDYPIKEITLKKDDKILFFTDGLTEAVGANGLDFEEEFKAIVKSKHCLRIKELIDYIYYRLILHSEKNVFEDDVCIVGMQINQ